MSKKIIDFFKFLEEKKGTKTPFEFKLIHQDFFNFTTDELNVDDGLDFTYTEITSLPDNLKINGYLDLKYTKITSLPDNLNVGRWLDIRSTPINSLPNNLKIGTNLYLPKKKIIPLPSNLTVGGYINITPDNLDYYENKYPQYKFIGLN